MLLIAERDGEAVGYAVVRVTDGPATWNVGERVAELESLAVATPVRSRGVGAMLLDAARDVARRCGAERLQVGVMHANRDAIRFYRRAGFQPFYGLLLESAPN